MTGGPNGANDAFDEALQLPPASASMALAVYRLEAISRAIHRTYRRKSRKGQGAASARLKAYAHFRSKAYLLLSHYVEHGLQEAFKWLLAVHGASPKRTRIPLQQNPFHWGLLAMTASAGVFMSPNKLRQLAMELQAAHAEGVPEKRLERYLRDRKRGARHEAMREFLGRLERRSARTSRE